MNPTDKNCCAPDANEIDSSVRVSMLALLGGAALWLVLGLVFGIIAGLKFHMPDFMGECSALTYGRAVAAANSLVLYGFALPAGLAVLLYVLVRLSGMPLALPLVPVVAANIWHLGVFVGVFGIFLGESTGYPWLEFPRAAAVLLFAAFLLIAVSAAATFGWRRVRELYPAHWFLFAGLLWFAWTYSSANLFLTSVVVPRGVVQNIIDWWFANNTLFVGLALLGVGLAFYFIPKLSNRPLANTGLALYAFIGLILFGSWVGIPAGAPVPAWLPVVSQLASVATLPSILAIAILNYRTAPLGSVQCGGGAFCFFRFGLLMFLLASTLYLSSFCPVIGRVVQFTWYGFGVSQLQLLGFFATIVFGGAYELLPRTSGMALPFPGLVKAHFVVNALGVLLFAVPLIIGGVEQGIALQNAAAPFSDSTHAALTWLRVSTTGQLLLLLGALMFAVNIFVMTIQWKIALVKSIVGYVLSPLTSTEVKA